MTIAQMPSHNHPAGIQTTQTAANSTNPRTDAFGITADNTYVNGPTPSGNFMKSGTVITANAGGGQSQNNMQPFLTMNYCVVTQGLFPSRS